MSICQLNLLSGNICAPQYTDLVSRGQEEPKILEYFCGDCFRRSRPRDVYCPCKENADSPPRPRGLVSRGHHDKQCPAKQCRPEEQSGRGQCCEIAIGRKSAPASSRHIPGIPGAQGRACAVTLLLSAGRPRHSPGIVPA